MSLFFKLDKSSKKEYDAKNINGEKIEIKSTIYPNKATSINRKLPFDILYWLQFNFEEDIIYIKKCNKGECKKYLNKKNFKKSKNRPTINLNDIKSDNNFNMQIVVDDNKLVLKDLI